MPRCRHIQRQCGRSDNLVRIYGRDCASRCRNRLEGACPRDKRCFCDGVCGWSCISIYEDNFCPEVSEQEGVLVTYNPPERRINGYVNFSCSEGYRYHSGTSKRQCRSNRQWGGGREYVCVRDAVRCPEVGSLEHGEVDSSGNTFGSHITFHCHDGYRLEGSSRRECQEDKTWSGEETVCVAVRCPEVGSLEHGEVDISGNIFGSHITFHCHDGYRLEGSSRRECQEDKTWSGEETVCVEIICEDPGVPSNGHRTNEKRVYRLNDVLYFGCDDGYIMHGNVSNYCTESGQWARPMPFCYGNCVVPLRPRNGWLRNGYQYPTRGTIVPHATRLEVVCSERLGFTARESSILCNNGVWSDSDDVKWLCEGTPCGVRYSPNLIVTYDPQVEEEDLNNNRIPHDTRVYYACERGYTRIGVTEARCHQGSYGQNIVPRCDPVPCPQVDVSHGRFTYHTHNGSNKAITPVHTDTRRLECNSGYKPSDYSRSYCDNGGWVNEGTESVSCLPRPCDPILEIPGTVSYLTNGPLRRDQKYNNGTVVYVNCFSDYAPAIGNGTAVCIASKWWPARPACVQADNFLINAITSQTPSKKAIFDSSYLARDGNTASSPTFCSRTERVYNPWWKAEITCTVEITAVKIYNRLDRHKYDLVGAEIRIGIEEDYTKNLLCGGPITQTQIERSTPDNHGILVKCSGDGGNGIIGRIISVHIPANEKRELSLCELVVYSLGDPYSVNSLRTCPREESQVACVVPRVENGEIHTAGITGGQVVLAGTEVWLGCESGYQLREDSTDSGIVILRCHGSSSWDTPVCEPKPCTVQRMYNGGFPGRKINYEHGENITFTCNHGFEKPHERYWCDKGNARPAMPQCVRASCNVPNLPDHMIAPQPPFAHGSFLNVSCEHGFQLSANQPPLQCFEGEWTPSLWVTCQRVPCLPPGRDTNSIVESVHVPGIHGYFHGARVRYSCSEGYEIVGNSERGCDNGHWTGQEPQCRRPAPPRCMLPERSNGEQYYVLGYIGNIFDEGLPVGERADISVRCNTGFIPQREVSARCLDGGVWSDTVPICVKMERLCPKPGYISRVIQYVNGLEVNNLADYPHDELPEGTFLLSRCSLPGQYVLQGSANRTCSDGRWMGVEPRCVASETEIIFQNRQPLETRSNGTIVIYPRGTLYIHCRMPRGSRKVSYFTSDSGVIGTYWRGTLSYMVMTLSPPRTEQSGIFTCRSHDESLSHSVSIQFAEINCDRPNVPANGELHDFDYGWKRGSYYMGKVVSYTCNSGYSLDGERRITCVFGQWSDQVPRCQRTTCPELQPPAHGTKRGGNRVGESVLIGCNYGYQLQGEPFLDCLESGEWSHPLPNCTEIVHPCDLLDCEVWQKCVIDSSNVAACQCISPHDCPASEEPRVCGSDGVYYTSLCHLKAKACLWDSGVDVASSEQYCIDGVPEYTQAPPTVPHFEPGELCSSSSFQSIYPVSDPDEPSIPVLTIPADNGPAEPDLSPTTQPEVDVDPSSYQFCLGSICPSGWTAEVWRNSTAVIIAFADDWQADLSILTIRIYEVMSGELQHWTKDSQQEVIIDDSGVAERGCMCPSFQLHDPVIIPFSQDLRPDGKGKLLGTDIVLPYSQDLYHEILNLL